MDFQGLKWILVRLFVWTLTLVYSWISILRLILMRFQFGSKLWEVKERSLPPSCLNDAKFGKHSYMKLRVL